MNIEEMETRREELKQQERQFLMDVNRQHGILLGQINLLNEMISSLDPATSSNGVEHGMVAEKA
jgi:hypothetical protein